jgi:hypothetical protein
LNVDRLRRLKRDPRFLDPDESAQRCDVALGRGLCRAADRWLTLFELVVPSGPVTPFHGPYRLGLVGLCRGRQDEEIYAARRACRAGRAPTRSGPGYVNVRCDQEEETAAWRWVCLRWRYDGER